MAEKYQPGIMDIIYNMQDRYEGRKNLMAEIRHRAGDQSDVFALKISLYRDIKDAKLRQEVLNTFTEIGLQEGLVADGD